jgi:hypothetical protein
VSIEQERAHHISKGEVLRCYEVVFEEHYFGKRVQTSNEDHEASSVVIDNAVHEGISNIHQLIDVGVVRVIVLSLILLENSEGVENAMEVLALMTHEENLQWFFDWKLFFKLTIIKVVSQLEMRTHC